MKIHPGVFDAINCGSYAQLRLWIERGGREALRADLNGMSPLHLVADRGSAEMARVLLHSGAVVDERDCNGNTPLIYAAASGNVAVGGVLLAWGARLHAPNAQHWTAEDAERMTR
jgi:ankyrin repeat protein